MKRLFLLALLSSLVGLVAFVASREVRTSQNLESAANDCLQVFNLQADAWNRGDLDGFMEGYLDSDDIRFYADNTIAIGFKPLRERYFKRYKAEGKEMGKLTFRDIEVVSTSVDTTVVRGKWKVEKSAETSQGLFTLVMKRQPNGWRIVHDHTSAEPKP